MVVMTDYSNLAADLRDEAGQLTPSIRDQLLTDVANVTARVQHEYEELVASPCIATLSEQSFQSLLRQQKSLSARRLVQITLWVDKELKECWTPDCLDSPTCGTPVGYLFQTEQELCHKLEARAKRLSDARSQVVATAKSASKLVIAKSSSKIYIDIKPLEGHVQQATEEPSALAARLSATGWDLLFGTNRLEKWASVTQSISRVVLQATARVR